ncbi:MAG: KUP/HAK/KT family potassium transporter [Spirochaetes bacterium]|nr:KUP/HAK/KT family potassium transporter [Spirochaetota bacterium]
MSSDTGNDSLKKAIAPLSLGALGVVFGDIGTSPLYTLRECFKPAHGLTFSFPDVVGVASLIFWAIVMVVVVKYVVFIMRADNQGEGGILSLLAHIIHSSSPDQKKSKRYSLIIIVGLVGTALLLADGMITPAISVLGAIEGLKTASPGFERYIVPLAIVILTALFLFQRSGTARIGIVFGPVMVIWFLTIGTLGLVSIIRSPEVLWGLNPWYAVRYFLIHKIAGVLILGAVVLAITGAEALFADLGHFGKRPIRIAWFALVFPALILNYFGQSAAVLRDGAAAIVNPFYYIAPSWALYPVIIIATAAAIIASQALISGAFSLVQQAMQLGYVPKMKIVHTSFDMHGQIYLPTLNYFLMAACIFLVLFFKSSDNLASAYGISVMGTMLSTTILFFVVTRQVWRWKLIAALPVCLLFFVVDALFLSANISKIVTGGWFPVLAAVIFLTMMQTWKRGSLEIYRAMSVANVPFDNFLNGLAGNQYDVTRLSGTAVFMIGNLNNKLSVLLHHLKHNRMLHETVILMSIVFERVPSVSPGQRLDIKRYQEGFIEVRARYGYMESPRMEDIIGLLNTSGLSLNIHQISFYVGHISLAISKRSKAAWGRHIFRLMHRNAESAIDYFGIPPGRVIEVGTQIEL